MSVSFMWEIVKPSKAKSFDAGLSSDIETLQETFGEVLTAKDIPTLRAMHRASTGGREHKTLWGEIAATLEHLSETNPEISIRVWHQF